MVSLKNILVSCALLLPGAQLCYAEDAFTAEEIDSIEVTIKIERNEKESWEHAVSSFDNFINEMKKTDSNIKPAGQLDEITKIIKTAIADGVSGEMRIEAKVKEDNN